MWCGISIIYVSLVVENSTEKYLVGLDKERASCFVRHRDSQSIVVTPQQINVIPRERTKVVPVVRGEQREKERSEATNGRVRLVRSG